MKKILVLFLALVMAMVSVTALAATPSKQKPVPPTPKEDDAFYFIISDDEELLKWANDELAKLEEAESIAAYFDQADEIKAVLGEAEYNMFEMWPVVAGNYDVSMGDVTKEFEFATPYKKGSVVAVMLGFDAGEDAMEWSTFEGKASAEGIIKVTVDGDTVMRVEDENALMAIVSK